MTTFQQLITNIHTSSNIASLFVIWKTFFNKFCIYITMNSEEGCDTVVYTSVMCGTIGIMCSIVYVRAHVTDRHPCALKGSPSATGLWDGRKELCGLIFGIVSAGLRGTCSCWMTAACDHHQIRVMEFLVDDVVVWGQWYGPHQEVRGCVWVFVVTRYLSSLLNSSRGSLWLTGPKWSLGVPHVSPPPRLPLLSVHLLPRSFKPSTSLATETLVNFKHSTLSWKHYFF